MRLFRRAGGSRAPWRKGSWVYPLWDKGALQLWGAASGGRVRGQRVCHSRSALESREQPQGDEQDLQEVWAELTSARNEPLRNLAVQCLEMDCTKWGEKPFSRACCSRTRSSGFKIKEDWFRLHMRKKLLTVWVLNPWNVLPTEGVDEPSLATFKVRLFWSLSTWSSRCPSGTVNCVTL